MSFLRITCIGVGSGIGWLVGEIGGGILKGLRSFCGWLGALNENGIPKGGFGSVFLAGTLSTCSKVDQIHCGRSGVLVTMCRPIRAMSRAIHFLEATSKTCAFGTT